MEKLYAYALDRKKTRSHAKFLKSSTAMVIELHFFMKKMEKMEKMMMKMKNM